MKTRTSSLERKVVVEAVHHAIPSTAHKGFVAYSATSREVVTSVRNKRTLVQEAEVKTFTGVCKKGELDGFLSGKLTVLPGHAEVKRGDWTAVIIAVRPGYLEEARLVGWGHSENWTELDALRIKDPIASLKAGEEVLFIECSGSNYLLFDMDRVPYPVSLRFDYMSGYTDNLHYDLDKAVEILSERDDVTMTAKEGYGRAARASFVLDVPGYNCEGGRTRHVEFLWQPTREDYVRAYNDSTQDHFRSVRESVFRLDLLGLRAGGAARHDTFHAGG
jgi:hypothetical protein